MLGAAGEDGCRHGERQHPVWTNSHDILRLTP
jgi:hypothetical protein